MIMFYVKFTLFKMEKKSVVYTECNKINIWMFISLPRATKRTASIYILYHTYEFNNQMNNTMNLNFYSINISFYFRYTVHLMNQLTYFVSPRATKRTATSSWTARSSITSTSCCAQSHSMAAQCKSRCSCLGPYPISWYRWLKRVDLMPSKWLR